MKYTVRYKSLVDSKNRTEVLNNLNELSQFILKVNTFTNEPEKVKIQSFNPLNK